MRYLVAAASLAALLAVAPAALGAPGKDYTGPSCTNIVSGDGKYSTFGGAEAILRWDVQTESPTCKNTTYTLVVLDATGATVLARQGAQGVTAMSCQLNPGPTRDTCVSYKIDLGPAATAPSAICIYGYSANGTKLNDRAPDTDCVSLTLDSGLPGGFFN